MLLADDCIAIADRRQACAEQAGLAEVTCMRARHTVVDPGGDRIEIPDLAGLDARNLHFRFDRYDSTHVVMRHPRLDAAALDREYRDAWRAFYTWRRLAWSLGTGHRGPGLGAAARMGMLTHTVYYTYAQRRGWHPLIGGVWRRRTTVRREAVTDDEALRRYLPGVAGSGGSHHRSSCSSSASNGSARTTSSPPAFSSTTQRALSSR